MKKTVLIFGGTSSERMVSVASAQNIVKYLKEPVLYYLGADGAWYETTKEALESHQNPFKSEFKDYKNKVAENYLATKQLLNDSCVFIALHGTEGEDGTIQKFFEESHICFVGSGSESSQLCFDKVKTKVVAKKNDIPVANELIVDFNKKEDVEKLKLFFSRTQKIVLKPVANGSSFGLFIIDSSERLDYAIHNILHSSEKNYLCEEFISGRELTVGVYENSQEIKALCPSEVLLDQGSCFDYEGKYLGVGSKEITPAEITDSELKLCQELAIKAHKAFSCYGYSRTDMILTAKGPVFLETNTLPGMTKASFYPQQLAAEGLEFQNFIIDQIKMALDRK